MPKDLNYKFKSKLSNSYKQNSNYFLNCLLKLCLERKINFAIWVSPEQNKINFITDYEKISTKINSEIDNQTIGFVFSPFIKTEKQELTIIKPELLLNFAENIEFVMAEQVTFFEDLQILLESKILFQNINPKKESGDKDKETFIKLTEKAINSINNKTITKVVLARETSFELLNNKNNNIDFINIFKNLVKNNLNTFVSLSFTNDYGLWAGATPELLAKVKNNLFYTESLAGTMENSSLEINWDNKNKQEQKLVTQYIKEQLAQLGLQVNNPPTKTIKAGKLSHIKTQFSVELEDENIIKKAGEIINFVHPTPAICGLPQKDALQFIKKNELINREIYSGFLGFINLKKISANNLELYVNLRCCKFEKERVLLFTGVGITKDSIAEAEYKETNLKMLTILDAITS